MKILEQIRSLFFVWCTLWRSQEWHCRILTVVDTTNKVNGSDRRLGGGGLVEEREDTRQDPGSSDWRYVVFRHTDVVDTGTRDRKSARVGYSPWSFSGLLPSSLPSFSGGGVTRTSVRRGAGPNPRGPETTVRGRGMRQSGSTRKIEGRRRSGVHGVIGIDQGYWDGCRGICWGIDQREVRFVDNSRFWN